MCPKLSRSALDACGEIPKSGWCESRDAGVCCSVVSDESLRLVLSRKSCVIAIPIEAKASEVRSQARKVRSFQRE